MKWKIGFFAMGVVCWMIFVILRSPMLVYHTMLAIIVVGWLMCGFALIKWYREISDDVSVDLQAKGGKRRWIVRGFGIASKGYVYLAATIGFMLFISEETFQTGCQFAMYNQKNPTTPLYLQTVQFCREQLEYTQMLNSGPGQINPFTKDTYDRWVFGEESYVWALWNLIPKDLRHGREPAGYNPCWDANSVGEYTCPK